MSFTELSILVGLALADSTSIGTLVIPVWLLMRDPLQAHRVLLYLTVIAGFYWLVSVTLLASMTRITTNTHGIQLDHSWVWAQLTIGAIVLAVGLWIDRRREPSTKQSSRTQHWRNRTFRRGDNRAMIGLALTAGLLELSTMVPLLTALGMLERASLSTIASGLTVTGYVTLMMLPACVLLLIRVVLGERITKPLAAIGWRLEQLANAITATVLIAVGGLISVDAAIRLGFIS